MLYDKGTGEDRDWIVAEEEFDVLHCGKTDSIMAQGNGYLGLRAAAEESYVRQVRGAYVAGVYNRACRNETEELANIADVLVIPISE